MSKFSEKHGGMDSVPECVSLSAYVKKHRARNGETQEVFAANCGLSIEYISLIEREKANPSLHTVQKIAAYTGDTVSEILETTKNDLH